MKWQTTENTKKVCENNGKLKTDTSENSDIRLLNSFPEPALSIRQYLNVCA